VEGKEWGRDRGAPGGVLVNMVGLIGNFGASLRRAPALRCCMFFEAPHYGNLVLNAVLVVDF